MIITIRNFGAVQEAEIHLKPLTIFIGENGTGKTWTAYTIAAIFGIHGFEYFKAEYREGMVENHYDPAEDTIRNFIEFKSRCIRVPVRERNRR